MAAGVKIPKYVWTFLALVVGLAAGGLMPDLLAPLASATGTLIRFVVMLVPVLILAALSPAVATLLRRGLAGRFAGAVVLWYVGTSIVAGAIALVTSALIFRIPFSTNGRGAWTEASAMLASFGQGGASLPLIAIVVGVGLGLFGAKHDKTYAVLKRVADAIENAGDGLAYVMLPLILLFGITLGVRFGARAGVAHYLTMTAYTAALCAIWWTFYTFVLVK
ncbi:MAG: cation:dicarboxylase symporter family transporter, partial [Gemmatimonadales bacterium]|nr:cation:dicarboxylase symporter family transporter [Gemmatimonadales bacterium]